MMSSLKRALPLELRRSIKISRARAFEAIGSSRFSRPALLGLDRKLSHYLQQEPGVFLEIGANDGYSQSNTYYLERRLGWRGILVEPLPLLFEKCRKGRPASQCFNFACVAPGSPATVDLVDLDLMSVTLGAQSVTEETRRLSGQEGHRLTVPAKTLSSIIDQAGEASINFMSVDVEGAEEQVLGGLALHRHTPDWLLVETANPAAVAALLAPQMLLETQLTFHDFLFRRA